ncbi:MAG: GMC family oxidoreductase [Betaproteobacteria bacterium HGW-Betaproteobacteria-13]|jgi:choline dehydrogenase-like flavoprotein|nr:MAG: GMC family oxidoreductase [Betaproteobacteria bacterium HGW-Betaproteobacteria-19]PKO78770.1 MAG: GMC family oxidoreductase [Betaproteobacteria bacterium HGW-Betaproteobacteria-13]
MRTLKEVEAVVVGAGQTGCIIANRFAEAGREVLVFDAGVERGTQAMVSSQIWARRLKGTPGVVESVGSNPLGINFNTGQGGGGAAAHHYACWFRLHPEDFEMHRRYGVAADWPIGYEDLRASYDEVQAEVGIAGDATAERWRPAGADYPLPPTPRFRQGEILARGFERMGMHVAPLPLAIATAPYRGRSPCVYDGWCDAGCPTGALANPQTTYLKWAIEHGATVRYQHRVERIVTDESGRKAIGVIVADHRGERAFQPAALVVIAGFALETPRLLLASANDRHPQGLANGSGTVGRYLHTHAAGGVFGLFDEPTECHLGVTGGQLVCQDGYGKVIREGKDFVGGYQWLIGHASKPNDLLGIACSRPDLHGEAFSAFVADAALHFGSMTAVGETLPLAENRVELVPGGSAEIMPKMRVHHRFDDNALRLHAHAMKEGVDIMNSAGARSSWHGPIAGMHLLGGTRMGIEPGTSVTDAYGRCHDLANLFIAGPGLFPSGGAVNPTFTASALAHRSALHILGNWTTYAN